MAIVQVNGVFMGANLHQTRFEGVEKTSVIVDVYQPTSPTKDKAVSIKSDDLTLLATFTNDYTVGDLVKLDCSVSAFKNDAFFKLIKIA